MRVLRGHPSSWGPPPPTGSAVSVGVYDGVHAGHRTVLRQLVADARRATWRRPPLVPTVLTFDRHPRHGPTGSAWLTDLDERIRLLRTIGIDVVGILPFSDVRSMPPEEFIEALLVSALNTRLIVVGHDFRFGYQRVGDIDTLFRAGSQFGFQVQVIEPVPGDGSPRVSSTWIRDLIERGDVEQAASVLGRPHEVRGVVDEFRRGVIRLDRGLVVPGPGAYVAEIGINGSCSGGEEAVAVLDGRVLLLYTAAPLPEGAAVRIWFRRQQKTPECVGRGTTPSHARLDQRR